MIQRIQRAFLVYKHTGKPLWFWQKNNKKIFKPSSFMRFFFNHSNQSLRSELEIGLQKC